MKRLSLLALTLVTAVVATPVPASAAPVDGQRPVPLRAPSPEWYTPELAAQVAQRGVTAPPVDAPLPGEVGIRPGSWMISPYWCTMNFIFRKKTTLAIGTAGHCIEAGEPVVLLTLAPTGGNPVLVQLGRVLLHWDAGIGRDYALVEIPRSRYEWVFPTLAVVGGPCGVYTGGSPQPVAHYGHGIGLGTGGTPRAGVGIESSQPQGFQLQWDADSYAWAGAIASGDSGSGVRVATMQAVGNLTHGLAVNVPVPQPSVIAWGTRITKVTSQGWRLINSPLCP